VTASALDGGAWIDLTIGIENGMVQWPGDPPLEVAQVERMADGAVANVTRLTMSAHTGTHVDAPVHFIDGAIAVDRLPPAALVGRARVLDIEAAAAIEPDELARHRLRAGERILLKTRNSRQAWQRQPFRKDYVHLSPAAAQAIADAGVVAIGIDYLSVGGFDSGPETHRPLLAAGVWIIEGLDLSRLPAGECELVCLPLKIVGSDGAPARAIARPLGA